MLIYSPDISPRLKYTMELVFRELLKLEFALTNNREELVSYDGACLNYSREEIEQIPFIEAQDLLFEDSIICQDDNIGDGLSWEKLPAFFPVGPKSLVPFDIFAAVFYLVSRYEEYLPFEGDHHKRFHSGISLASRFGFIDDPIVNQWLMEFVRLLERTFPGIIKTKRPSFAFEPSIDIDNAWAFRHKGFWRTAGSILRSGQSMETRNFRYQVLRGKQQDPFDQYQKIERIHSDAGFSPRFFFLVGPYGKFDRNISTAKKTFRNLIKDLSGRYETGLHPSYASFANPEAILQERIILEEITGRDVSTSRQHYLRLRFPISYQSLLQAGISNDFSMGYADRSGFRAGLAQPFYFFDLVNNKSTSLRVFPFQVMDTGLRDYEGCDPEKAIERISMLMEKTKAVGGTFISLWHNESFSEWMGWEGWTEVYREMLSMAGKKQQDAN